MYTCICVCICTSMRLYTCVRVRVCMFVHRLWVLVSVLQRVDGVMHAHVFSRAYACVMMMIAFITIKSSLVPLIEGLCAQIYFRFEISVVCSHLLLFFFVKEKTC